MKTICVDFGGTFIKIGILESGKILKHSKIEAFSGQGLRNRLGPVKGEILEFLNICDMSLDEFEGIGLAIPGIVDSDKNMVLSMNGKYEDAVGFDFNTWASDHFGLPLVMDNDANLALLGEYGYGCAQGEENVVMLILGTGVGSSVLIHGRQLKSKHYQAGCLGGHFVIRIHGQQCSCGGTGCVEMEASSLVLPDLIQNHPSFQNSLFKSEETFNFKSLIQYKKQNDAVAMDVFNHCIAVWSAAVVNLVHAYDPEMVVLSGGVMKSKDEILPLIQTRVNASSWTHWGDLKFEVADDPEASVLKGLDYMLGRRKGLQ